MQTHIKEKHRCKDCKWPVVFSLCNDGMMDTPPYNAWDWWLYCSNKTCKNHAGEGFFQYTPEWIEPGEPV
ncbi:hypothetical protein BI049_gp103 [Salmonella phage vB_SnwM_CGG4-1]|uniref:Uncharacterized protein n=1 Tax=Salmonella phage vB_SnwM_CGG4-1 TaxID=1815631 RepID=A0A1B0VV55_9CAUD|nr:hypothetical protein BI049_gp103 [Salmonella phage vB_SnwM_CGG4-1]ANA49457.1 hypothetical protein CGG41_102 [Salmonella phage vB_SnwM_CGG4-1]